MASSGQVVIAYVHPGQCSALFTDSLLQTFMYDRGTSRRIVGVLSAWSSANISQPRNRVTAEFLEKYPTAEWLLWVDADMCWGPSAVDELVASADPDSQPIVGGLCFGSGDEGLFPTIYLYDEDERGRQSTVRVFDYPRGQMVQCAATGAAFLLIHRRVLETVRDKGFSQLFPWFQECEYGDIAAGEDITFCIRAGICGFGVAVNTAVRVGHHKSRVLDEETFDRERARG